MIATIHFTMISKSRFSIISLLLLLSGRTDSQVVDVVVGIGGTALDAEADAAVAAPAFCCRCRRCCCLINLNSEWCIP